VNLTITNVPGPQFPLYCLGAEVLEAFPYVGIVGGQALTVAVLSYNGNLDFGLTGDREVLPDLDLLAEGILAGFAELEAAFGVEAQATAAPEPEQAPPAKRAPAKKAPVKKATAKKATAKKATAKKATTKKAAAKKAPAKRAAASRGGSAR
jgi:diacylglycerol O-acyltransferase